MIRPSSIAVFVSPAALAAARPSRFEEIGRGRAMLTGAVELTMVGAVESLPLLETP